MRIFSRTECYHYLQTTLPTRLRSDRALVRQQVLVQAFRKQGFASDPCARCASCSSPRGSVESSSDGKPCADESWAQLNALDAIQVRGDTDPKDQDGPAELHVALETLFDVPHRGFPAAERCSNFPRAWQLCCPETSPTIDAKTSANRRGTSTRKAFCCPLALVRHLSMHQHAPFSAFQFQAAH